MVSYIVVGGHAYGQTKDFPQGTQTNVRHKSCRVEDKDEVSVVGE